MIFDRQNLSHDQLLSFYRALVWPRLIEEKMLVLLRQGRIGKWFSGIGQEAIAVGSTLAMRNDEYILPMHRNLGVFTARDIPLFRLMAQWQGKPSGFTKGRDRSFHFGSQKYKIIGMISHLGPQMAVATGIALADVLAGRKKATLVFTGEGATSQGDFHEALNLASVWKLPVIFLIENNGYALSTTTNEQYNCEKLTDRAKGYGMESRRIDGNNLLEVYHTIKDIADDIRENPRPFLVECMTFRMRGHEEASGTKYVPEELMAEWKEKDPITCYENFLIKEKVLQAQWPLFTRNEMQPLVDSEVEKAMQEEALVADTAKELEDVYKPHIYRSSFSGRGMKKMRFMDAVSDAMRLSMHKFPNLILMGQDIAGYGGVFKLTEGFAATFGTERVRNTPLCESAVIGAGLGLAINGFKSVIEMQFADFVSTGFNQVINNVAKTHYRWGQQADVVIRMPTGAGTGAGPFHSQSNEAWFTKTPGLKVVYPSSAADAKGLLMSAIQDPNPVMYFEHKYLYRSLTGDVPEGEYKVEIGKAKLVNEGTDFTIITYGLGVHWACDYAQQNSDMTIDIIDLRTLQPWDKATCIASVKKTGRALILHEDTLTNGFGGEIAAALSEECFGYLDAPIMRCASLDTPVPMDGGLEKQFLANSRLEETIIKLLSY
ncbi:alpha-ketoacid dehydrogenase subunit alpha/beta [Mucilaginibacter ginkgonis]|uniref:Dehydrogenase E1 component subunit alpha/beta n=1 Tax=Mucilaginibacter ginkgonis TaxID=2682091 RepID=A0A6I4HYW2_9SPHI|nr:dehydrogenase E1 component subunit alpha/beta [Mucilaginibacter ginkgonis]QQL49775.1 dehydrogenase E1 component subunit alpha/beta [Mucilaginibacter ginkgonis]